MPPLKLLFLLCIATAVLCPVLAQNLENDPSLSKRNFSLKQFLSTIWKDLCKKLKKLLDKTPKPESPAMKPSNTACNCSCGVAHAKYRGNNFQRIVGGENVKRHTHPWMALVLSDLFCGGTIINSKFVLTAAHCVNLTPVSTLTVILGDHDLHSSYEAEHVRHRVTSKHVHPGFNPSINLDNDIALLQVADTIKFQDHIQPACLPSFDKDPPAAHAWTVGWGQLTSYHPLFPRVLQETKVPLVNVRACKEIYGGYITTNMICAGGNGRDSCKGDSGGPLIIYNHKLTAEVHGVVSWGRDCGEFGYPGVYAKVVNYIDWMKNVTNTKCVQCL